VVIVSVVVVLALIVTAAVGLVLLVRNGLGPAPPDQPLLGGAPGSPVAIQPLVCETACFTDASVPATLARESEIAQLGVTDTTEPAGTFDPVTAEQLVRSAAADWEAYDGAPDACFFAPASSPVGATLTFDADSDDAIHFTGTHQDEARYEMFDQAVRVFPDSATAEAYMSALSESIDACHVITIGPPEDRYSAEISPAPALDPDPATAAVGWVRTGDPGPRWRAYVFDVQFGNLVVRSRMLTDGRVTEQEFRSYVEGYSAQLAALPVEAAAAGE
jgi:hypothetical protein